DIIMFDQLDKESIRKIIDLELAGLYKRVEALGYRLELTDRGKDFIATKGYDVQFGARPLKRAIQKYLEDEMAEIIIQSDVKEGDTIVVDYDETEKKIVTFVKQATE
ncbi:MAG: ATP-dependent Clp protease ATP-binding subunit, partial [Parabacteroides sp.]